MVGSVQVLVVVVDVDWTPAVKRYKLSPPSDLSELSITRTDHLVSPVCSETSKHSISNSPCVPEIVSPVAQRE
jgi:hypothetical protein